MSLKFNKLFRKWSCFGGKTEEDEIRDRLRQNQPKIVITECRSIGTSPTFSNNSESSSSESSQSDDEIEAEILLKTDGEEHKMGMDVLVRTRTLDESDGGCETDDMSLVRVTNVEIGSFAHGFGVRKGDIVCKVNGQKCSGHVLDIKELFLNGNSDKLEMEILRNVKNQETGVSEILKMTISNARRIGGTTEEEVKIIQITGSSLSLGDFSAYFKQPGEMEVVLQFESEDTPWLVNDSDRRLGLSSNLSEDQVMTDAQFCMHVYWSPDMPSTGYPIVLQHVTSGLCVSLVGEEIELVEEHDLEYVSNPSIIFIKRVPIDSGPQVTFQSALDKTKYLGFHTRGRSAYGYAVPIHVQDESTFGEKEKNVVFIETQK